MSTTSAPSGAYAMRRLTGTCVWPPLPNAVVLGCVVDGVVFDVVIGCVVLLGVASPLALVAVVVDVVTSLLCRCFC